MTDIVNRALRAVALAAMAVTVCSQPGWAESFGARTGSAHGHLYVLDASVNAVDRFPLDSDGLPARKPDSVLTLEGAEEAIGMAVDRSGHVFVADQEAGTVTEFAAGATGNQKPILTLNLPNDAPDFLKLDRAERLYVHYGGGNQNESIAIFAKGARGDDPPISVIAPYYNPELASDYVIADSGALFITDLSHGAGILGYYHPLDSPPKPDVFMWPEGPYETNFVYTLALDYATNDLYIQFDYHYEYRWDRTNFAVRALPSRGYRPTPDPLIFNGQCAAGDSVTGGAVIAKSYLMVSCIFDGDVLVFRKDRFGKRQADEIVGKGTLHGPTQIAVGP